MRKQHTDDPFDKRVDLSPPINSQSERLTRSRHSDQYTGDDLGYPYRQHHGTHSPVTPQHIQSPPLSPQQQRTNPLSFARGHRTVHVDAADAAPYRSHPVVHHMHPSYYNVGTDAAHDPAGVVVVDDDLLIGAVTPVRERLAAQSAYQNPLHDFQNIPHTKNDTHDYKRMRDHQDSPDPRAMARGSSMSDGVKNGSDDVGISSLPDDLGVEERTTLHDMQNPVRTTPISSNTAPSKRNERVTLVNSGQTRNDESPMNEENRTDQSRHFASDAAFTDSTQTQLQQCEQESDKSAYGRTVPQSSHHPHGELTHGEERYADTVTGDPYHSTQGARQGQDNSHLTRGNLAHSSLHDADSLAEQTGDRFRQRPLRDTISIDRMNEHQLGSDGAHAGAPSPAELSLDEPQEPNLRASHELDPPFLMASARRQQHDGDTQRPVARRPAAVTYSHSSPRRPCDSDQNQFMQQSFATDTPAEIVRDHSRSSDAEAFGTVHEHGQVPGAEHPPRCHHSHPRPCYSPECHGENGNLADCARRSGSMHSMCDQLNPQICRVPNVVSMASRRTSMPTIMRKIGFRKRVTVEALPRKMEASVLWASDCLPHECDARYPYTPTTLVAIDPARMLSPETEETLVSQGSPFEIRVCGMSVTNFDFPLGLFGTKNELVLYSIESEELSDGSGVTESVPNIHFDFKKDSAVEPDVYQPIPESRSLVLRGDMTKKRHVNVRFNILEVDDVNPQVKRTISDIGSLSEVLSDIAVISPYMSIIMPALHLAGKVGNAALESYAKPDRVISVDMNFQLIDRAAMRASRSGAYLQYGYYFFLSKPCEAKLYASTLTPRNVRLMMHDTQRREYVPLNHISYVVVRVRNSDVSCAKTPVTLSADQSRRLQKLCEGVFDMDADSLQEQLKDLMSEVRGSRARTPHTTASAGPSRSHGNNAPEAGESDESTEVGDTSNHGTASAIQRST